MELLNLLQINSINSIVKTIIIQRFIDIDYIPNAIKMPNLEVLLSTESMDDQLL
ncbi:3954_t:CDS:2 [Dentiscutata erythropus]|uniref:3954_t:CDS:1 n=1 Tax=Dentiscutata erythropus TaxID=1348616 RepID=A0A9N8VPS8_9GLOM|nr:3954_t:CDS:2 [Dentiscutata erythropus]